MINWKSSDQVSSLFFRAPLGLSMVLIGVSAYRDFAPFVANVTDSIGFLSPLAYAWAFVLPALLIFGGALLTIGRYSWLTAILGGLALGSVPVGLILKNIFTGVPLPDMMAASYPIIVWLIAFYFAVRSVPDDPPSEVIE